ncbi:hypothetical protein [Hydrogenophaga sp. 5NK40-0174]|uniref:hypothetical protein n=1 Tax=Hydrogenophaga sp. 5NK40-0174 TaxID=3127649 RepID=UPI00310BCF4B
MAQRKTALNPRTQPEQVMLTAAQVGAMLGGSTNATARELMRREGVTVVSLGGRFLYPKAEVMALIERNTIRKGKA